jgi:hypothetical protein
VLYEIPFQVGEFEILVMDSDEDVTQARQMLAGIRNEVSMSIAV